MLDPYAAMEESIAYAALEARRCGFAPFIPVVHSMQLLHIAKRTGGVILGVAPPLFLWLITPLGPVRVFESATVASSETIYFLDTPPDVKVPDVGGDAYEALIQAAEALMNLAVSLRGRQ